VIGPLALSPEPHAYDLCDRHARTLTAPRGWDVLRPEGDFGPPVTPPDDLIALVEAVRETRREDPAVRTPGRRGHLRVLP
jgi:hypothetical protein